jgi:hypothetical protein
VNPLAALAAGWRTDAETLDGYGAVEAAAACRRHADELDAALREAEAEELTLAQAVEVSGYSERRLRELATAGEIPNVGRKGAPRFRRGDLPKRTTKSTPASGYDPAADARSLIARIGG